MKPFDVLVVGSGVAGLTTAVRVARARPSRSVALLTKGALSDSTTRWAQGGVAAVLGAGGADLSAGADSTDLHLEDTLSAGAGLCHEAAVRLLVEEGPARVHELIAMGARFDRDASGTLSLAREGGHSRARVVHAGGAATGAEVERALAHVAASSVDALLEHWFALDLLEERGRCVGVAALAPDGRRAEVRARHVVLATGGTGQLFAVTTNPVEATGDGIAMALRAGVAVADVEFVQFHPTALHHPAVPRPLLSEALRGHGALLRDGRGERFVDELAPRDVVSRAMAETMAAQGLDHLYLDATGLEHFADRFPTIAAALAAAGLDPSVDLLPVAPAAHHVSGGVVTDLWGATALPGLWAAGEAACTGVHGANRLASNSLLEGLVFGARVAEAVAADAAPSATGVLGTVLGVTPPDGIGARGLDPLEAEDAGGGQELHDAHKARASLAVAMTSGAGVARSARSLAEARRALARASSGSWRHRDGVAEAELENLCTVGRALLAAALEREESRGSHTRTDFPAAAERWRVRLVHAGADRAGERECVGADGRSRRAGGG